ncbi:hypothetical protein GVAV_002853 [Gurleya vavrai]
MMFFIVFLSIFNCSKLPDKKTLTSFDQAFPSKKSYFTIAQMQTQNEINDRMSKLSLNENDHEKDNFLSTKDKYKCSFNHTNFGSNKQIFVENYRKYFEKEKENPYTYYKQKRKVEIDERSSKRRFSY